MNRETINSVPIPIIILQDHKLVLVNKEAMKLFGAKREDELIGTLLLDRIHSDFKDFAESRIKSLIDDGNQVPFIEEDFLHLNGSVINAEASASSVSYLDKPAILIVIKDINKQNQIEQKRIQNYSLLRATLESTADGIVVTDNSGRITDFNKKFTDIWRIPDVTLSKPIDKQTSGHILDQIINPKKFLLKADKIRLHPEEESFDVLEFKDGRFFERYSRPQLLDGKPIGRVWSYRDITERKLAEIEQIRTEKQLSKYSEELKTSNATKDKFFSIIAHDLRSPFQGMLGLSEVIVNDFETLSKEELKYFFNMIRNSLSKQFELLSDLLEWSRLQTGSFILNNEVISLFQEVDSAIDPLVLLAEQKKIKLENLIDKKVRILIDKQLIKMIIHNLVSNSIKFTKENGFIKITAEEKENFIEISVTDTGIGIPEEAIQRLFKIDDHYSTDGTNHEHGTGLGLILCKDFAEKAGGQIWAESQVGKGSTFTFSLPIQ